MVSCGFSGNAIFEFNKKQGLDLRADLKKVPDIISLITIMKF